MTDPARLLAAARRFLTDEDVTAIQMAVPIHLVPSVVDLGSGSGTTALAVLGRNPEAAILSVDNSRANRDWAEKNVEVYYPEANIVFLIAEAADVAGQQTGESVDVLLHDAGHSYEDVIGDLRAWLPHCHDLAAVWVHDHQPPPEDWGAKDESEGVRRAVAELVAEGLLTPGITKGLGWLGKARHA